MRSTIWKAAPGLSAALIAILSAASASPAERLANSIRFETVSSLDGTPEDAAAFDAHAEFLERSYPNIHRVAPPETVGGHSLMFRWPGKNPDAQPFALLGHLDVVPVEPGTEDEWTHPAYEGVVANGAVWGRGALDCKGPVIASLEAVERLIAEGFQPENDVYLLFGHDEEVGGATGAKAMADLLAERGVRLAFTLDEGSGVVDRIIRGARTPIALISTAEKGSVNLRITARADGGHSSTPGPETAVTRLARAVLAVKENPHPLEIDDNVRAFLKGLAPAMPQPQRFALQNLWLTGGFVKGTLAESPVTAAALRTTTAPTIIRGGVKSNVLPQTAEAIINYRIHPRDSVESVRARAERLIDDPNVTVEIIGGREPSPASSAESEGYRAIAETTLEVFGDFPVAPTLTLQGTDSKHYGDVADNRYRFTPFIYRPIDLSKIHGTDEAVSIENLNRAVDWYALFLKKAAG
ncbi:MAG: M20/M25/M40 family metallo-hydrolase [Pseudomonadota bacterium]